jgi:hypothetical protein
MAKQTAGRNILGEFAPQFAALNDDVLFGEVWSREAELPAKMRSIVTISALLGIPAEPLFRSCFPHGQGRVL